MEIAARAVLRKVSRPVMVALALSCFATASFALGSADERAACTPDVFRLCSSEIPNVSKIIACMQAKKTSLSPACRAVMDKPSNAPGAKREEASAK
jgi:hypothetical protein